MKKNTFIMGTLAVLALSTACKQQVNEDNVASKSGSTYQTLSMTPAQATALYQDDQDLRINCALYQLADAVRNNLSPAVVGYISQEMHLGAADDDHTVFYDDLFAHFPSLKSDVDAYLSSHEVEQAYAYNNYGEVKAALTRNQVAYDAAVYMPDLVHEALVDGAALSATNMIWAIPVEVDEEDLNSTDQIFAWDLAAAQEGSVGTVSVGSADIGQLVTASKLTVVTGVAMKGTPNYDPDPAGNNPVPYNPTVDPWAPGGGSAQIHRIKIYERYESNKYSEVKMSKGSYDWVGVKNVWDYNTNIHVKDVHKNDIWHDQWIAPVYLTDFISYSDDRHVVYNLFEYDWYGHRFMVGGKYTNTGYSQTVDGTRKYFDEVYLFKPYDNTQASGYTFSHPQCYTTYYNGSITMWGNHGECQFLKH